MFSRLIQAAHSTGGIALFYLARLVPGALNFILVFFLGNELGKREYGLFSIWFALAIGGGFFFFGWITQAIARHANAKDDLLRRQPEAFLVAAATASLCVYLCAVATACANVGGFSHAEVFLLATSVIFYGLHASVSAALQARLYVKRYVLIELIKPVTIVVCTLGLLKFIGSDHHLAMMGYVIGQIVGFTLAVLVVWRALIKAMSRLVTLWRTRPAGAAAVLRSLFFYGAPISVWLALTSSWPALERILLGAVMGPSEVGRYALEYDIVVRSFVFTLLPLTLYTQPHIFRAFSQGDMRGVGRLMGRSVCAQACIGLLYAAVLACAIYLFGARFNVSSSMRLGDVFALCASAIVWQAALMCHKWLECKKRIWAMVATLIFVYALVALPIAAALLKVLGAKSFAVGSFIAGLSYCSICVFYGKRVSFEGSSSLLEATS